MAGFCREEMEEVLRSHAEKYPLMRPEDTVKLIFQNEFGGGHLIQDPLASLEYLKKEYGQTRREPSSPLTENIGNGMVRVMLGALEEKMYSLEWLNQDFVNSAEQHKGDMESFLSKLDILRRLTSEGIFAFSVDELEAYLEPYIRSGCPPVSHSSEYREAYCPAYRIVLEDVVRKRLSESDIASAIEKEIENRRTADAGIFIVAIDGRCASGKSTLAEKLHNLYGYTVVHMDDFFLRPEQRTEERYCTPGGNVDYERFLYEVLLPLEESGRAEYRRFDCGVQRLTETVRIDGSEVVIAEGSYSCHPQLRGHYALKVFMSVGPEEQMRRIEDRNGSYAEVFREKWIPLEELYISKCEVEESCDLRFET